MRDGNEVPAGFDELSSEYEVLGELGRGGMAVVYHARERGGGREVALKVIRAKYVEDEEVLARFAHEARTLTRLKHPNIVSTYAVRRLQDGSLALVMEHVPGRTLRAVIRQRGPLPYELVERVLCDIGRALDYAHRKGIVHRDVKPDNIFIHEQTGAALLSDFGIAKSRDSETHLTMTGVALGTPAYMSPEQIDGLPVDGRSDLYSLGVVGWEMLSGRRAWEGETLYSTIYKQKHEELTALRELRPDLPEDLELLLEGALLKEPAARWANVEDFLTQLAPQSVAARRRRSGAGVRRRQQVALNVRAAREQRAAAMDEQERTVRYHRPAGPAPAPAAPPRRLTPRTAVLAAGVVLLGAVAASVFAAVGFRSETPGVRLAATQVLEEGDGEGMVAPASFLPPADLAAGTAEPAVSEAAEDGTREDASLPEPEAATARESENRPVPPAAAAPPPARTTPAAPARSAGREPARQQRQPPAPAASARREPAPPASGGSPSREGQASSVLGEPVPPPARSPAAAGDASAPSAAPAEGSANARSARRTATRRECTSSPFGSNPNRRTRADCDIQVSVGQSFQLSATTGPLAWRSGSAPEVGWRSSNPAVATVDENGIVRAVRPGRVTITATAAGMGGTTTIVVTAPAAPVP